MGHKQKLEYHYKVFAHWGRLRNDRIRDSPWHSSNILSWVLESYLMSCLCQEPCGISHPMTQSKWRLWTMHYMH